MERPSVRKITGERMMNVDYHQQVVRIQLIISIHFSSFSCPIVQIGLSLRKLVTLTHAEISSINIYCYLDSLVVPSSANSLLYKIQGFFKTVNRRQLIRNMFFDPVLFQRLRKAANKCTSKCNMQGSVKHVMDVLLDGLEKTKIHIHKPRNLVLLSCLDIFGANPPSSPKLHSWAPCFSVITACHFFQRNYILSNIWHN